MAHYLLGEVDLNLNSATLLVPILMSAIRGPQWFYNELVPPTGPPPSELDPRSKVATWQLTICKVSFPLSICILKHKAAYALLYAILFVTYRGARDFTHNMAAQERFTGHIIGALIIGDVGSLRITNCILSSLTSPTTRSSSKSSYQRLI